MTRHSSTATFPIAGTYLGNGDGTFAPARTYAVGSYPVSVAVGDFTGDGILDLAVASSGSDAVSVLRGNGDGSFAPAQTYVVGYHPSFVVVGDFAGNGVLDIAVTVTGVAGTVSVLRGNGDGTFAPTQTYAVGPEPAAMTVGDFNGDGIPDLAVTGYDSVNGTVSVLLGNGDGTFQAARNFPAGADPASVAVGDFNGDGIPDLVVANDGITGGTPGVSVLLGNGDGAFTPAQTYFAGYSPYFAAAGDFNGDGAPDLAVANLNANTVTVLLNGADWPGRHPRAAVPPHHRNYHPTDARPAYNLLVTPGATHDPYTVTPTSRAAAEQPACPAPLQAMTSGPSPCAYLPARRLPVLRAVTQAAVDLVFAGWADPMADDLIARA